MEILKDDVLIEQKLCNIIWESEEIEQRDKDKFLLYIKSLKDKINEKEALLNDSQTLLKQILVQDIISFSKANNVLPFEYPDWISKYNLIFKDKQIDLQFK
jgi:hypothetical protein